MNFEVTNEMLETIKPYLGKAIVKAVSEESKDGKGNIYKSDVVIIDEKNDVGFEVSENEIIVFYFTDHRHFEDYTSEPEECGEDYKKRAVAFLIDLLEKQIKQVNIFKGKKLAGDKYGILSADGTEEFAGGTCWRLLRLINPFLKKKEEVTVWQFDKQKGFFVKRSLSLEKHLPAR